MPYGEPPAYNGTPTRQSDATHDYVFDGWDPALSEVSGEAEYTVKFRAIEVEYTVTFVVNGGDEIAVATRTIFAAYTLPSATREGYVFKGWYENGNTTVNAFTFYCRDDVSPEITVDGTLPETAAKDSEITLCAATATDNYSDATLTIYVTAPDGSTTKITDGKLKFGLVGKYRVTYFAADADCNTSSKTFTWR